MFDKENIPISIRRRLLNYSFHRFLKQFVPFILAVLVLIMIFYEVSSFVGQSGEQLHGSVYNYSKISWAEISDIKVFVNDSVARSLKEKIKILCLVPTVQRHQESRALAVNLTWGTRCSQIVFVSTQPLMGLPHIILNVPRGKDHLTAKTISMFDYAYQRYINDFDWFLKADDDTFIVIENLRFLLMQLNPKTPSYLGFHFRQIVKQGYMSGGAGYIISQEALRMLGRKGLRDSNICRQDGWGEDVDFGQCLENRGVLPYNTVDVSGRDTFLPLKLSLHLVGPIPFRKEFEKQTKKIAKIGPACCSQLTISFHQVSPDEMYQIEFLLYRMTVYGRNVGQSVFNNFIKPEPIITE